MLEAGRAFGSGWASEPLRIQVELVSANPTGPITVAAARNGAYGDAVARLLSFAGHDVEREYYYNDAGAQMERFRVSVDALRRGEEPPEDGYRGAYVADLARGDGDPVPRMLDRIEETLARFRVQFDTFEQESAVEAEIPAALAGLETYESEGAVWARTSEHGDDKDRVVVRSDGTTTYFAADAAYIRRKFARGFDHLVYVLGADHHGYVARLAALSEMLGHPRESVEVLVYQLVHLTQGGAARRCRNGAATSCSSTTSSTRSAWTRRGGTCSPAGTTRRSRSTSTSPPSGARRTPSTTCSTRTHGSPGSSATPREHAVDAASKGALEPQERDLVKRLLEFPEVVREATDRRAPHAIPTYAIRVADDFHRFYTHTVCSRPSRSRSASRSARRRGTSSRHASTSSGSRRPSACRNGGFRGRIATAMSADPASLPPDRNLALELVRVTEAAAMGASRWIGRGDKIAADQAAVDLMRLMVNTVSMRGVVVIGEGEKDEAPMLFNGEEIGDGSGPEVDVAVDPLEGTRLTALGIPGSISVIAVAERGSMFFPGAAVYMDKIAVGPHAADAIDIDAPPSENVTRVAEANGRAVNDVTVVVLERERHDDLIAELRESGARVNLIRDGDVAPSIAAASPGPGWTC